MKAFHVRLLLTGLLTLVDRVLVELPVLHDPHEVLVRVRDSFRFQALEFEDAFDSTARRMAVSTVSPGSVLRR